jgi:hypothetical protein
VPFEGADEFEVMQRHMTEVPVPPSATLAAAGKPGALTKIVDAVILQALEKDREHRYSDMQRFARSLHAARSRDDHEPEVELPQTIPRKLPRAAIAIAIAATLAAIAWALSS